MAVEKNTAAKTNSTTAAAEAQHAAPRTNTQQQQSGLTAPAVPAPMLVVTAPVLPYASGMIPQVHGYDLRDQEVPTPRTTSSSSADGGGSNKRLTNVAHAPTQAQLWEENEVPPYGCPVLRRCNGFGARTLTRSSQHDRPQTQYILHNAWGYMDPASRAVCMAVLPDM